MLTDLFLSSIIQCYFIVFKLINPDFIQNIYVVSSHILQSRMVRCVLFNNNKNIEYKINLLH